MELVRILSMEEVGISLSSYFYEHVYTQRAGAVCKVSQTMLYHTHMITHRVNQNEVAAFAYSAIFGLELVLIAYDHSDFVMESEIDASAESGSGVTDEDEGPGTNYKQYSRGRPWN